MEHSEVQQEDGIVRGQSRISREEKNERERTRIKRKGDLLEELKEIIKASSLIQSDAKRKRFTEVYTMLS